MPAYVASLGLPGLADVHVHFMPDPMQRKVWAYFDGAEQHYGLPWPITYRLDEECRLETLRALGLRAVPALVYPHKPGMAGWLNDWCADFARRVPDAVHCATFYPEPGVGDEVARGARRRGAPVQDARAGRDFTPDDARLDVAWTRLEAAQVPVVLHAGSAPIRGTHTGPEAVREVLRRHPDLVLVVAHLGMPEYHEFADLADEFAGVHLDTTMSGTDFTNQFAPFPDGYVGRLGALRERVVLGSDFPSIPYPYAHQLDALTRLGLGDDWMRAVLWHNGARLLDLT